MSKNFQWKWVFRTHTMKFIQADTNTLITQSCWHAENCCKDDVWWEKLRKTVGRPRKKRDSKEKLEGSPCWNYAEYFSNLETKKKFFFLLAGGWGKKRKAGKTKEIKFSKTDTNNFKFCLFLSIKCEAKRTMCNKWLNKLWKGQIVNQKKK